MTDRTFASWVEPIAAQLRESRAQIIALAGSAPAEAWSKPSPNEGWTCKDLLAHLATGDWVCQTVLRAAVGDEAADLEVPRDLDAMSRGNARLLKERATWSVEELLQEVQALRAAVGNEAADPEVVRGLDAISRGNARLLEERATCSVEELLREVQAEGEETQELLARLTEAHEPLSVRDAPMSLGEYLRGFPNHDRRHLAELRRGLAT